MNRGVFHGSLLQPVVAGSSPWPATNNLRPVTSEASSPLLLDLQTSNSLYLNSFYPQSWSQLLLGGLLSEEQLMHYSQELNVKKDNMLDFTNNKAELRQFSSDHFSHECNSIETGACMKKARLQGSSSSKFTNFKVRKEKLGDRITALHQMVSPFGKTDTASVLLEAIGYIRFLQSQIEALSSPYLNTIAGNTKPHAKGERNCIFPEDPGQLLNGNCMKRRGPLQDDDCEPKRDLRSRGLCLVPVSCTLHVGTDDDAEFWAPSIGGAFR